MSYSEELRNSFLPEVLEKVKSELVTTLKKESGKNLLDIAAGFIPVLGCLKADTSFQSIRDYRNGVKLLNFMTAFSKEEYDPSALEEMIKEIQDKNQESFFETIIDVIDRIDNQNKATYLSNLLHHSIKGDISRENFLRHCWILSQVPFIDLQQLYKYTVDYYQPSSSEILNINGLIQQTIISAGTFGDDEQEYDQETGSKYGLTQLGEEMLHFGMYIKDWQYRKH